MNARTVIRQQLDWLPSSDQHADLILHAIRRAAGGADRVVLAWEPTPCAECEGKGGDPRTCSYDDPESSFYGHPTMPCEKCGGSGVDGYTVTLHTLELWSRAFPEDGKPALFRLVAVSPEPPKEPRS